MDWSTHRDKQFDQIKELLIRHDPIGLIKGGAPGDEYYPELPGIYHVTHTSHDRDELMIKVHQIFIDWFGLSIVKQHSVYDFQSLADDLWYLGAERRYKTAKHIWEGVQKRKKAGMD